MSDSTPMILMRGPVAFSYDPSGGVFTSEQASIIFNSIDQELSQMVTALSTEERDQIDSKLEGIFRQFQKCMKDIESLKIPYIKAKLKSTLTRIQANYETVALGLRGKCWSIGITLLGHYPSASDERLAEVKRGWREDLGIEGRLAAVLKK